MKAVRPVALLDVLSLLLDAVERAHDPIDGEGFGKMPEVLDLTKFPEFLAKR